MTALTLRNVQNKRSRDLLRGLLDRGGEPGAGLSRLLDALQGKDVRVVDELMRTSQLFRHIETRPEFPEHSPFQDERGVSLVPNSPLALDYVAHRIAQNESTICDAFRQLDKLNHAIHAGSDELVVQTMNEIIARFGHSLTLARKAAFVIGYSPKDTISHRMCTDLLGAYGANAKNYGIMATIDTIGPEFSYLDIKFRFKNYVTFSRRATITRKISQLSFSPVVATAKDLTEILSASYEISLIDAAIVLLAHRDQGLCNTEVSKSVLAAWKLLSMMPEGPFVDFRTKDKFVDLWAFRSSPAFIEYPEFRGLRLALQPIFDLPATRDPTSPMRRYSAEFFSDVIDIKDLVPAYDQDAIPIPTKFNSATAGVLARSCALLWICEKDPDFSGITAEEMALLMGETFEIDRLIPTAILRQAAASASSSFVTLILQTLLRAHSSATRDNFNFKSYFQDYVRQNHDGDIMEFMKNLASLNKNIVHYFVNLLDETMLSQMAFLMSSSEYVYETRASLLEWFSDIDDSNGTRDKAKQLRIDRKIAAVRGVINETRLNIDSVRFRQWVEQNKLIDFSDFIRQSSLSLPSITDLLDHSKAATQFLAAHREPSKLALLALLECYNEFCRNSDFGIASFLGRRIRHGTLRGTLLNSLPNADATDLPPSSQGQYDAWSKEFSKSIDSLVSRLYFRDKLGHKDGLLNSDINNEQKWQLCLVCLTSIYNQAQQDHGVLFIPLLIEQYCWLIFETELAHVHGAIAEARSRWGTLKLRYGPGEETVAAFERDTNIAVSGQFSTVMSWFRKPPNISPVAEFEHIIEVVVQEAKDEYSTFDPAISFVGASDLKLSGATYYVVYDALTIAIRNAAKHGRHPGKVRIAASMTDVDERKETGQAELLEIKVTSLLKECDNIALVLERVEEAGSAGAENADVIEGLSGIRKLKKMEADRSILGFAITADAEQSGELCTKILIPFKGLIG